MYGQKKIKILHKVNTVGTQCLWFSNMQGNLRLATAPPQVASAYLLLGITQIKAVPVDAMKRIGEQWYGATYSQPRHRIHVSGQHHSLVALPPQKLAQSPLNRRVTVPQRGSGRFWEEKLSFPF